MRTRTIGAIAVTLWLTGGVGLAATVGGYVKPGVQFTMTWTPANPPGDAYLVERSFNGGTWTPMLSVVSNEYVDTLVATGDAAQYRVSAYKDITFTWTDRDGTHSSTSRVVGPVSDVSDTIVAQVVPTPPGGCGKPTLK